MSETLPADLVKQFREIFGAGVEYKVTFQDGSGNKSKGFDALDPKPGIKTFGDTLIHKVI